MGKGSPKGQKTAQLDVIIQNRRLPKNLRFLQEMPKKKGSKSE